MLGAHLRHLPIAQLLLTTGFLLLGASAVLPIPAQGCIGDCDGNGVVAINELIVGVNIALGTRALSQCPRFDADRSETVTINELIAAVNVALGGCRSEPPEGVLLQGDPGALAIDAIIDMPPVGVDASEIEDGVILTRLDLHLAPDATVGEVNAALQMVNGGVVSMAHGLPALTIAIPRPVDLAALVAVVQTLRVAPGVSWTDVAHVADPKVLPPSPAGNNLDQLSHLLASRFPAAWNASHLATPGCTGNKVNVLVADFFQLPGSAQFNSEIPNFTVVGQPAPQSETHGCDVTTTLAGLFDAANPTGANPFSQCLQIEMIQLFGLTEVQIQERIASQFPAGKFVLNYSGGYPDQRWTQNEIDHCKMLALLNPPGCTAADVGMRIDLPLSRAYHGAEWIGLTANRWNDFVASVAAGNENDTSVDPGTAVYPGLGVAAFDAGMSVATVLPDDAFLSDTATWNAQGGLPGLPNLTASNTDVAAFRQYLLLLSNAGAAGPAENVLIVGSTKPGRAPDALAESDFSDSDDVHGLHGPDVFAVGEQVFTLETDHFEQGTSFSAPEVAGLASYLWLLSPALRNAPAPMTREAIVGNSRGIGAIDAYASALSLDAAALPTTANAPVRLAILNVNGDTDPMDSSFDEADLRILLDKILTSDGQSQDYSRYDLNGDGFTGGNGPERFDLDRVGSLQYGFSHYSTVQQTIEGETIDFPEAQLTDLQILCYYAYSALYTGDPDMRRQLTAGLCTVSVTVDPAAATVAIGGSRQFAATVRGTGDPRVTWSVAAGTGTISATGLFTAGQSEGTATVRATSVADPNAFGEATVTVRNGVLKVTGTYQATAHSLENDISLKLHFESGPIDWNGHGFDPPAGPGTVVVDSYTEHSVNPLSGATGDAVLAPQSSCRPDRFPIEEKVVLDALSFDANKALEGMFPDPSLNLFVSVARRCLHETNSDGADGFALMDTFGLIRMITTGTFNQSMQFDGWNPGSGGVLATKTFTQMQSMNNTVASETWTLKLERAL